MTNEIKEILEILKNTNRERPLVLYKHNWTELLDYITNLQEENEKLKKIKKEQQEQMNELRELFIKDEHKLLNDNQVLQQRIDKTIKYCEESSKTIKSEYFSDVLKILQGEE